jgi:hypothetical protein
MNLPRTDHEELFMSTSIPPSARVPLLEAALYVGVEIVSRKVSRRRASLVEELIKASSWSLHATFMEGQHNTVITTHVLIDTGQPGKAPEIRGFEWHPFAA